MADSEPKPDDFEWADNPSQRRWEVAHGGKVIAFAEYRTTPDRIVFTHTVVDPEYEGHGIGSRLARLVLDDALHRNMRITPRCPFIRAYIQRHPEYADSTDMPERG